MEEDWITKTIKELEQKGMEEFANNVLLYGNYTIIKPKSND